MFLLRAVTDRLLQLILGLAGIVALFAGLAFVGAALLSLTMRAASGAADWVTEVFIGAAVIGAVLLVGGMLLGAIQAKPASKRASRFDEDRTLPRAWVWPATVPTLLLPAFAAALSWKLVLLWRDIFVALERMGIRFDISRANDWSNWLLLPMAAALFVPLLEVLSAILLVALPPVLLVALAARSHGFRMNAQRLVVLQAMFVAASLVGTELLARLAARLVPAIQAAGGPEAPMVLDGLARGREVLTGTAWGHAAVLAAYSVCLWVLMAAHGAWRAPEARAPDPVALRDRFEGPEPPADRMPSDQVHAPAARDPIPPLTVPAPVGTTHERVSDLPRASRQAFEEVLARFRERHGRRSRPPG